MTDTRKAIIDEPAVGKYVKVRGKQYNGCGATAEQALAAMEPANDKG